MQTFENVPLSVLSITILTNKMKFVLFDSRHINIIFMPAQVVSIDIQLLVPTYILISSCLYTVTLMYLG